MKLKQKQAESTVRSSAFGFIAILMLPEQIENAAISRHRRLFSVGRYLWEKYIPCFPMLLSSGFSLYPSVLMRFFSRII